jgi:uncharacterized protein (TIGR02145 family)
MNKLLFISAIMVVIAGYSLAQTGSVTVTSAQQRTDGSGLVDVYFNLSGPGDFYFMNMRVSFDVGSIYYPISRNSISGDIGPISPGSNKHLVWDPLQEHPGRYSPQTKLMVIAYLVESMNPCPGTPTLTDYDGNVYNTVLIGNQCWMKENLNTTRTSNGNYITRYCYGNNPVNCDNYGGLYTWATLMNGAASSSGNPSGVQGICPNGWHVPSDAEWTQLTDYLINNYVDINSNNVGNKLKSCRQVNSPLGGDCSTSLHPRWESNATHYGTNDFGFSALPGGMYYSGYFDDLGAYSWWWSSTEYSSFDAWARRIYCNNGSVYGYYDLSKSYGFSVRCVRD